MPKLPDYKRPFDQEDFRGYFRWSQKLTDKIGGNLYHACHANELREVLTEGELTLRSEWSLRLPTHGLWTAPGIWTGLNYFRNGNKYGPLLVKFPLSVLNGKHFVAFRRVATDRNRYFFVQYEARIPIYSFGKKCWRNVRPESYFQSSSKRLKLKPGAIYDIVITQPLILEDVEIRGVEHPSCIPQKCNGMSEKQSRRLAKKIAVEQFEEWMATSEEYRRFFLRFPESGGAEIELNDPDDL